MILVGYARVSTQDQKPDLQLDALREAGCKQIFCDKASAVKQDRIEFVKCLAYCEKLTQSASREKVTLVIWKLDRASRSLMNLCQVVKRLEDKEIGFRCLTQAIDTTTPGGKLVFHIFGAIAEFEREMIRERTRAGMAAARRRGVRIGRPAKIAEQARARVLEILKSGPGGRARACKEFDVTYLTLRRFLGESPP